MRILNNKKRLAAVIIISGIAISAGLLYTFQLPSSSDFILANSASWIDKTGDAFSAPACGSSNLSTPTCNGTNQINVSISISNANSQMYEITNWRMLIDGVLVCKFQGTAPSGSSCGWTGTIYNPVWNGVLSNTNHSYEIRSLGAHTAEAEEITGYEWSTWQTGAIGAQSCGAPTPTPVAVQYGSCSLSGGSLFTFDPINENRIVATYPYTDSDGVYRDHLTNTKAFNLNAGTYNITLQSADLDHPGFATQSFEMWYAIFSGPGGDLSTPASNDIPDASQYNQTTFSNFNIPSDITSITGVHARYLDPDDPVNNTHSVAPICIRFEPVIVATPTPTPTPTPTAVSGKTVTLSASPASIVQNSGDLSVTWNFISGSPYCGFLGCDWIGMFLAGAGDGAWLDWVYASGNSSGTVNFTSNVPPGTYEFRYFEATVAGGSKLATSNQVSITAAPTPTPTTTATPTPTATPTSSPTPTPTSSATPTPTPVAGSDLRGQTNGVYDSLGIQNRVVAGQNVYFRGTISNRNNVAPAGASVARVCVDNASCLTSSAGSVGEFPINALASPGSQSINTNAAPGIPWLVPIGTASHTYRVCADVTNTNSPETNESNNCSFETFRAKQCADGVDNDGDGFTDHSSVSANPDVTGCLTIDDDDEMDAICSDRLDNDCDGFCDFAGCTPISGCGAGIALPPDPICTSAFDNNENAACNDGINNDGDIGTDMADPGCHSDGNPNNPASYDPNDDDESNTVFKEVFMPFGDFLAMLAALF